MRERKKPLCGTPNAYNQGCRCGLCKAHHAHRCAEQKRARLLKPIPAHVHGTYGGYANWDCRCDGCSAAAAVFMREQYVSRLAREVPDHLHGTVTGYKPSDTGKTLCGKPTATCMAQGWFRGLARTRAIAKRRGLDLCETCLRNASVHCESFSDRKLWPDEARRA